MTFFSIFPFCFLECVDVNLFCFFNTTVLFDKSDSPDFFLLNVLFSDETKLELNSKDKRSKIRRRSFESSLNLAVSTVKHPFSIIFWGYFSFHATGFLKPIEKTLRSEQYKRILESCLLPSPERVEIDPHQAHFYAE